MYVNWLTSTFHHFISAFWILKTFLLQKYQHNKDKWVNSLCLDMSLHQGVSKTVQLHRQRVTEACACGKHCDKWAAQRGGAGNVGTEELLQVGGWGGELTFNVVKSKNDNNNNIK